MDAVNMEEDISVGSYSQLSQTGMALRGKKGAAFTLRDPGKRGSWVENLPKVLALRPYWNYSWGLVRPDERLLPRYIEFLPMFWGLLGRHRDDGLQSIRLHQPRMILCLNEPDNENQSNIAVERALAAWPEFELFNLPLVSPSCVNAQGEWMQAFMEGVKHGGLRVDAIGVHHYGGTSVKGFKTRLESIHVRYMRPVIVTEFAVADWSAETPEDNKFSPEKVLHFMQEVLPWLEDTPWILGYAWFSFERNSAAGTSSALFGRDGSLTVLGEFYASFKPNHECAAFATSGH